MLAWSAFPNVIFDADPLVFAADRTHEIIEGDKPQSVHSRVMKLTLAYDLATDRTDRARKSEYVPFSVTTAKPLPLVNGRYPRSGNRAHVRHPDR
jgi:hypothetical protein